MNRFRFLTVLLFAVGALLAAAPAAQAIPGIDDCKDPPVPEAPGRGMNGWILPKPDEPSTEDPFADSASVSIFEVYGTAGMRFTTYNLGCGPDAARDPAAAGGTALANYILNGSKGSIAGTAALASGVYNPDWLGAFDEPLTNVSTGLRESIFDPLAPIAMLGAGLVVLWAATRMRIGKAATTALFAVLAFIAAATAAAMPVTLGQAADSVISGTTSAVNNRLAGTEAGASDVAAVAPLSDRVLYEHWLAGTLGSASSDTAEKYGPDLYRASALSWAEADIVEADPGGEGGAIIEEKAELWTDTAAAVQENDPDAYEYLVGRRSADRVGEAVISNLACFLILPFLLMAFLLMIAAFIIIRFLVMMLPVFALLWILPSMHSIAKNTAMMGAAAVINSIVFGVGSTITIVVVGLLLDPTSALPSWLGLLLAGVFCVIMWITLAPFRRLTALVTGADPMADTRRSYERMKDTTLGLVGRVASTAAGSKLGTKDIAGDVADSVRDSKDDAGDAPTRPEAFSRPTNKTVPKQPEGPQEPAPGPAAVVPSEDAGTKAPVNGHAVALPRGPVTRPKPEPTSPAAGSTTHHWRAMPEAEASEAVAPVPRIDPVVDQNGQEVFVIYTPEEGWGTTRTAGTSERADA